MGALGKTFPPRLAIPALGNNRQGRRPDTPASMCRVSNLPKLKSLIRETPVPLPG